MVFQNLSQLNWLQLWDCLQPTSCMSLFWSCSDYLSFVEMFEYLVTYSMMETQMQLRPIQVISYSLQDWLNYTMKSATVCLFELILKLTLDHLFDWWSKINPVLQDSRSKMKRKTKQSVVKFSIWICWSCYEFAFHLPCSCEIIINKRFIWTKQYIWAFEISLWRRFDVVWLHLSVYLISCTINVCSVSLSGIWPCDLIEGGHEKSVDLD